MMAYLKTVNSILKNVLFLFVTFSFINGLYAQAPVNEKKIKIRGTAKTESINCNGETLLITGNRHKITVKGYCFQIVVYDDECTISLESVRLITLHGNKNKITYKVNPEFKTRINRFGDYNRVEEIQ
jgi:hypothetical protein